ncbi:hypothetical protein CYMTET_16058 [Cymbomonas tetramitiformis]|uniref:LOV domain-containing protein n=1 Tax=Cymbomonas tetramitiformis TaxID=36881 RepID=A0AAE0GCR3_9CHLO|nr:hypothetical protein CYMTET_16058 [Cymbomonas tetramitiformis]
MRRTKPKRTEGGSLAKGGRPAQLAVPDVDFATALGQVVGNKISFCLSDLDKPDCPIIFVSPEFCQMTGYPEEEVVGKNCRFLQGEDTDPATIQKLRDAIKERQECQVNIVNYKKDGTKFVNMLRILPILTNEQSYYMGIQLERGADSFLPLSPALPTKPEVEFPGLVVGVDRLQNALSQLCSNYVISDAKHPDNPIVFASPGFYSMTGYGEPEVVGKNCRFLQGFNTNPATVDKIRKAIKTGTGVAAQILNYKKDGTPFWNLLVITNVRGHGGEVQYQVGVQMDVTENELSLDESRSGCQTPVLSDVANIHNLVSLMTLDEEPLA